jgi:hypothetical protein
MKSQKPQTPMLQLRKASYTLRDYAEAFAKVGFGAEDLVKKYLDIYERVILEGRTRLRNTRIKS